MVLHCGHCHAPADIRGDVPKQCAACGTYTRWTTASFPDYGPLLKLTRDDIAFLHHLAIDPQCAHLGVDKK